MQRKGILVLFLQVVTSFYVAFDIDFVLTFSLMDAFRLSRGCGERHAATLSLCVSFEID